MSKEKKSELFRATFYIKRKAHETLRKKSFDERKSMSKILSELIEEELNA